MVITRLIQFLIHDLIQSLSLCHVKTHSTMKRQHFKRSNEDIRLIALYLLLVTSSGQNRQYHLSAKSTIKRQIQSDMRGLYFDN